MTAQLSLRGLGPRLVLGGFLNKGVRDMRESIEMSPSSPTERDEK